MTNVLLITATIAPRKGLYRSIHNTPRNRLGDYRQALGKYLRDLERGVFSTIVFVENSAYDLAELRQLVGSRGLSERVKFVGVAPGPTRDVSLFYLELELLRQAFASPELSMLPEDTLFWKVTGRYVIENIGAIVRSVPSGLDLYVNSRNYPTRWTDFYLAALTRRAFELVLERNLPAFDNMQSGEETFRRLVDMPAEDGLRVVKRFRYVPRISGTRGHDRFNYGGVAGRLKYFLRVMVRTLLPWLWI